MANVCRALRLGVSIIRGCAAAVQARPTVYADDHCAQAGANENTCGAVLARGPADAPLWEQCPDGVGARRAAPRSVMPCALGSMRGPLGAKDLPIPNKEQHTVLGVSSQVLRPYIASNPDLSDMFCKSLGTDLCIVSAKFCMASTRSCRIRPSLKVVRFRPNQNHVD